MPGRDLFLLLIFIILLFLFLLLLNKISLSFNSKLDVSNILETVTVSGFFKCRVEIHFYCAFLIFIIIKRSLKVFSVQ